MPTSIVMVARRGRLAYVNIQGFRDSATREPLREDAIFRLYSMTKPIVSIAALSLLERKPVCPFSKYIPEFKTMSVGVETFNPKTGTQSFQTVPAKRQIAVEDLLRHTWGNVYEDAVKWITDYRSIITIAHVKDIAPQGQNADEDGWSDVGRHGGLKTQGSLAQSRCMSSSWNTTTRRTTATSPPPPSPPRAADF